MRRLQVRRAWLFPSPQATAPCPGPEAPGAVCMEAHCLLLGWLSERPEEVRGVAGSPVEPVLTALRLPRVPGVPVCRQQQLPGRQGRVSCCYSFLADWLLHLGYPLQTPLFNRKSYYLTTRAPRSEANSRMSLAPSKASATSWQHSTGGSAESV